MLFWRGWGILVFIVTFAWIFIAIGIVISSGFHEPDEAKATADIYRLFAVCLIVSAACVFFLARYRDNTPGKLVDPATGQTHLIPHIDEFMFIRGGFGVKAKLYTLQIVLVEFGGKGER